MPVLVAALCAVLAFAARRPAEGRSEACTAVLGLLVTAMLLAAGVYEVLLHELLFCAERPDGGALAALRGIRGAYCGFLGGSGYWPAFVPAIAVLLASTVALERGLRPLVLTAVAAVAWSVLFGVLPLVLPRAQGRVSARREPAGVVRSTVLLLRPTADGAGGRTRGLASPWSNRVAPSRRASLRGFCKRSMKIRLGLLRPARGQTPGW